MTESDYRDLGAAGPKVAGEALRALLGIEEVAPHVGPGARETGWAPLWPPVLTIIDQEEDDR